MSNKDQTAILKTTGSSKHKANIFLLPAMHYTITAGIYTTGICDCSHEKRSATKTHEDV